MVARLALLVLVLLGITVASAGAAPVVPWQLLATYPHDPTAFTQGLVSYQGVLLESTGLKGQSSIRRVDPQTGVVLARVPLAASLFGEGLTVLGGKAVQLTWTDHRILTYDPKTLVRLQSRVYRFVGWGLTTNGTQLIASDGTATVRWLDPTTLNVVRSITVTDGGRAVDQINELELRNGVLWANVWHSDRIALIDPTTGRVRAWVNLRALRARLTTPGEVLNGIARDPISGQVAVTGKYWSELFVIRLTQKIPR